MMLYDPVTGVLTHKVALHCSCFATAAAVASIASAAIGTAGAIAGGEAQAAAAGRSAEMARYQAQVSRNNAIVADQMADSAVQAGQRKAEMESMKTAARVAHIRAGFGARGVDVNSGSAVDVQASEREVGKLDAETALANEQMRAYGYRSRASGFRAEGDLYGAQATNYDISGSSARTGGYLKAGGTLLSAASQVPAGWFAGPSTTGGTAP